MQTSTTRRAPIGAILLLIGGVLGVIGSFLTWADVRIADVTASAKGVDGTDGYITVIAGLVAILVGVVAFRAPKRALAVLGIVAGLILMGVGIFDAVTAEDNVLDSVAEEIGPTLGATVDQVRNVLEQQADSGQLDISIAIGLYAVIAGGALALIGGVIAAASAKADATPAAPSAAAGAPSGPAPTGPPSSSAGTWPSSSPPPMDPSPAAAPPTAPPSSAPPPPPGTTTD